MPEDLLQQATEAASRNPVEVLDSILYSTPFIVIQVFSFVLTIALFIFYIHLMFRGEIVQFRSALYKEALTKAPAVSRRRATSHWGKIQKRMASDDEAQWKVALIEADTMLGNLLIVLGFSGADMAERMQNLKPGQIPYFDEAWRVHKVRNFIVQDPSYSIQKETAEKAIEIYKKIFEEFKII